MSADAGERSEKATPERLRRAIRKGQIGRSQDLTAWVAVGAAAVMTPATIDAATRVLTERMLAIRAAARDPDPSRAVEAMAGAITTVGGVLLPLLVVVLVAATVAAVAQGGVRVRGIPMRFEQFDLAAGVARTFGKAALWEGLKALLKTAAIGAALWVVVAGLVPVLMVSGRHAVGWLIQIAGGGVATLLQVAVAVGLVLAAVDVAVVIRRNRQHTRMTKQEARDEHKKSEGDPLIRSQRRARQLAVSRNRMIAAVGDSDVVLLNPTHVAVALRYEPGRSAPRVVAKGAGVIAQKIRERAEDAGVPMVRDIVLARALHAAVEVGHEIPEHLYTAVAQVLAFVQHLRARGSGRGTHTMPPDALLGRGL
ncbi:flagellar biosynthesis protein FlhB [Microbacterium sp. NPDC090007]|uniref:EscU/YscU/HrcU family type III secretion system export apparatus switch protein n=1 Tax=Microbacterium sp. NPDC090007 TaxID=3364204 RepID=UPI0037FAF60F